MCFATTTDGLELTINSGERYHAGAIAAKLRPNEPPAEESPQVIARSFTDFLLRAADGGNELFFPPRGFRLP
jgi:hypothetical protein